ncbi:MAG: sugar phosphate isomerase/epimerase, partial [bacterium]|nr:sugar phosphate isomerase/epimerase [bacterium]
MKLLISSYTFEPFPLEEVFLFAHNVKADGVELVITPQVIKLGFEAIKKLSEKYQVPVVNIHQPPWYVLFTGKKQMEKMIAIAKDFNAENLVVHLATVRRNFNSKFFDWIKQREVESKINIAFENAAPRSLEDWPSYCGHPEKLESFVKSRNINLTLDVAKSFLKGFDPYQFFQRNHNNIKVIHAHGFDHQGDFHKGFLEDTFDWAGFASFIKKFNYTGAITMEIFPLHKLFYFKLPPKANLDRAKDIAEENFRMLKR